MKRIFAIGAIALTSLPLLAADRTSESQDEDTNVLFTITVADAGPDGSTTRRSTRVLVLDGKRSDLEAGWRIPIATSTLNNAAAPSQGSVPQTSFQYQKIGFSAWLEARITDSREVRARGQLEVSAVDRDASPSGKVQAPEIATFSHRFEVVLGNGVEARLAEVTRPEGGSMVLTMVATIQD